MGDELAVLQRGLEILDFVQEQGSADVALIVQELKLPQSTAYRYVAVLKQAGYLSEVAGRVQPSGKLTEKPVKQSQHLVNLARPVLAGLCQQTRLSVTMTVRVHTTALCLDTIRAQALTLAFHPGTMLPLYAGASALPLLAWAPGQVLRATLEGPIRRYTARTPDREQICTEAHEARRRGHHISHGWLTPGHTAIGVPVLVGNHCLCALSLIRRGSPAASDVHAIDRLLAAAQELLQRLPDSHASVWLSADVAETTNPGES